MSEAIYACLLGGGDGADDIIRMRQFTPEYANIITLFFECFEEHRVCGYDDFWVCPSTVPFPGNMTYFDVRRIIIDAVMYVSGNVERCTLFLHSFEHTGQIVHYILISVRACYCLKESVTTLVVYKYCFSIRPLKANH